MLDPRTIRALAARPGDNGRDLNVAIAEEGDAHALASLLRHPRLDPEAVAAVVARIAAGRGVEPGDPDEDPPRIEIPWEPSDEPRPTRPWTLERALLSLAALHPRAPGEALRAIADKHASEAGFVLAAAIGLSSPPDLAARIAVAPARSPLHDRPWLDVLSARTDIEALTNGWADSDEELLREAAARLTENAETLKRLARDPNRRIRRAVALHPSSAPAILALRSALAHEDTAIEVRACASGQPHPRGATHATRALARAARSIERGGNLDEQAVSAIRAHAHELDPELAWVAGLVLDPDTLATVVQRLVEHDAAHPSARAIVGASMVRTGDDQGAHASLAGMLARAIVKSYVPVSTDARGLTGHARLVAFLAELLADATLVDEPALVEGLAHGALVSDPALAARWVKLRSRRDAGMMGRIALGLTRAAAAEREARPPACALEAAWADRTIEVADLCRLARVVKPRRDADAHIRGRADGTRATTVDFDPDPTLRPPAEMPRVIEALDPWMRVSPRALLVFLAATPKALATGGREVRGWTEGAVASQLHRVLRAARGPSEADARVARLDVHADEAGVAVALLARSVGVAEVVALMERGLRLRDGLFFAAIVEALAALSRSDDVRVLVDALAARRRQDAAALCAWLVVGGIDRPRTTSVLAGALDAQCAATSAGPLPSIYEALVLIERREPGTLERLRASTRAGQAAVVNALGRAYPGLVGH